MIPPMTPVLNGWTIPLRGISRTIRRDNMIIRNVQYNLLVQISRNFAEIFASQAAPLVSTTTVANLPPVSTTPVAKWPPVRHRFQLGTSVVNLAPVPLVSLIPMTTLPPVSTMPVAFALLSRNWDSMAKFAAAKPWDLGYIGWRNRFLSSLKM